MDRLRTIQLKLKVNLEEMHGIGGVIIDVQTAACEVLINQLIICPEVFEVETNKEKSDYIIDTLLNTMKNQNYNTRIVECGFRFLALFAKNYPEILRKSLEGHKMGDLFLEIVGTAKNTEIIAHSITVISAVYANVSQTEEENEKVCKLLIQHLQSPSLRVVCETLNALFDIYSEETYDNVLKKLNLIPTLEQGIPELYDRLQKQKNDHDEEELEFFEEILFNLEEFCKYKRGHM